jgi:hypothetical protein
MMMMMVVLLTRASHKETPFEWRTRWESPRVTNSGADQEEQMVAESLYLLSPKVCSAATRVGGRATDDKLLLLAVLSQSMLRQQPEEQVGTWLERYPTDKLLALASCAKVSIVMKKCRDTDCSRKQCRQGRLAMTTRAKPCWWGLLISLIAAPASVSFLWQK